MKIRFMAAGAVLAVAVALTACGGGGNDDKAATELDKQSSGEPSAPIDVWIMEPGSPALEDVIKGYATAFQAANPGTTVKIQFVP